eukprot:ANDGO_04760.mRNA.1 Ornithine decarboxylase
MLICVSESSAVTSTHTSTSSSTVLTEHHHHHHHHHHHSLPSPLLHSDHEHKLKHHLVSSAALAAQSHLLPSIDCTVSSESLISSRILEEDPEMPFYVFSISQIVSQVKQWHDLLPRVEPFYAMKCNPNPVIVGTLAALGWSFDCASSNEISLAREVGTPVHKIIYANPCKQVSHIRYAHANNIRMMTFDNEQELIKIASHHPEAQCVLRIAVDDSQSVCQFNKKFGAKIHECPALIKKAIELGVDVIGVSFHVGSGCKSASAFADAVATAKSIFNVAHSFGISFSLLDLGGGYPGYDEEGSVSFSQIAKAVRDALDTHFPEEMNVRIIAEPGRYIAASCATLVTKVHAVRTIRPPRGAQRRHCGHDENENTLESEVSEQDNDDEQLRCIYINDGVYGSFNCIIFDHLQPLPEMFRSVKDAERMYKTKIFGPTCDSMDCVLEMGMLPEVHVGDFMIWKRMGAYTSAAASTFNAFPTAEMRYVW